MYYLVVGLYVLICFLLLVVVLLQQGKGGDIAAAFGGSSSQTAFGARAGATFLTRATAVLATLFMVGAFALGIIKPGGSSVVSGVQGPAATPVATPPPLNMPPPTPTGTPPATSPAATPGATDKGKAPATTTTPKADPKKTGRGGV
jgi:preprotein translocase subunit SecG